MQIQPQPKTDPRRSNGSLRNKIRARVLREETHCWLCLQPVDKTNLTTPGEHHKNCTKPRCTGCKRDPMSPEVDEIIPVSKGGDPYDRRNCRLAHRLCNQRRGNKDVAQTAVQRMQPLKTSRQWR